MSSATEVKAPAPMDPVKTKQVKEYKHFRPLLGCRFDPSGRFVAAGAQGNLATLWSLSDGKKVDLAGHNSWVRSVAFSRDGSRLFTSDYGGRVYCWLTSEANPKPVWSVQAHHGWVRSISISPDNVQLASGGNDQLVRLWAADTGRPIHDLHGHSSHVYNAAFHPHGKVLVSADLKGIVKVWNASNAKCERELDGKTLHKFDAGFAADIGGVRGMAFSADGALLACAGITEVTNAFAGVGQPLVVVFDFANGKPKHLLRCDKSFQGVCWGVVFHPTGYVIGAGGGGSGGAIWFWKLADGKLAHSISSPSPARDIDLHPDGKRLVTAHYDSSLRVHELAA